jgi:hypothetical protein
MQTVVIIADDSMVIVDGAGLVVDLTGIGATIHAVQWNAVSATGFIEYKGNADGTKPPPTQITDFTPYNVYLDRYEAIANAPPPTPPPVNLVAYANQKQWLKASGGYTTTINSQSVMFKTDVTSLALITGKAARFQQANPPASVDWQIGPSSFITIAAADFMTLAANIADFIQSTFDTLATVISGIQANTITTTAQIDSAFA